MQMTVLKTVICITDIYAMYMSVEIYTTVTNSTVRQHYDANQGAVICFVLYSAIKTPPLVFKRLYSFDSRGIDG